MLEYDRIITRTNINVLLNIGPGGGCRKEKKEVKKKKTFLTLPVITLDVTTSCKIYTNYIFDFIVRMNSYDVK